MQNKENIKDVGHWGAKYHSHFLVKTSYIRLSVPDQAESRPSHVLYGISILEQRVEITSHW